MTVTGPNHKTHLITGGTGALGTVVTKRLLSSGDRVAATWLFEHEKEALSAALGNPDGLSLIRADVTNPDSVDEAVTAVIDALGSVDSLIHLVGAWAGGEQLHEHSLKTWDKMLSLNLTSDAAGQMRGAWLPLFGGVA